MLRTRRLLRRASHTVRLALGRRGGLGKSTLFGTGGRTIFGGDFDRPLPVGPDLNRLGSLQTTVLLELLTDVNEEMVHG